MKVGDWVRRKPDNYTNVWVISMKDQHDKANRVINIDPIGVEFEGCLTMWDVDLFEPADQVIFNNLIDAYYDEGSKD